MEHLIFVCPTTGREVDSGVASEIGTLLRIRQQNVRALCPACRQWHEWPVRDAFLAKPPNPIVTSPGSCRGCAAPWRP
jgi:hypothetical protein